MLLGPQILPLNCMFQNNFVRIAELHITYNDNNCWLQFRFRQQTNVNPANWENCSMFIQDLNNHSVNVTAEISDIEVATFQKFCLHYHKILGKQQNANPASVTRSPALRTSSAIGQEKVHQNTKSSPETNTGFDSMETRISEEAADLLVRTQDRIKWEEKILRLIDSLLSTFDTNLKLVPFGSSSYGFGGANTNFNILINASML